MMVSAGPALAASSTFTILRGDEPIGRIVYQVAEEGGTTTVRVESKIDAKVLFISYHLRHTRIETWRSGVLQKFVSDTNDDGTIHHIEATREGDSVVAMVDGISRRMPGDAVPFTLWSKDLIFKTLMFDVTDFQTLHVQVENKGADTVTIGGQKIEVQHYRLIGDEHWDLWFTPDGTLVRTQFTRRGYQIYFVKD